MHQYSADVQRELPGDIAVTAGYVGTTARDIGFGGTANVAININQIPVAVARAVFPLSDGSWDPTKLRRKLPPSVDTRR